MSQILLFLINSMFNFLDINECSSDPCGDHEDCEDGIGSYTCKCEKGYLNDGTTCQGNLITKRVFIWRTVSPFGRASHTKRAGFHLAFTWEKPALLPGLARLAESPELTKFIFPRNQEKQFSETDNPKTGR